MTTFKLVSAGLVAAGMLTTPVLAQERYVTEDYATSVQPMPRYNSGYAGYAGAQTCAPGPRVGAFASEPWDDSPPCGPYASGYPGYSRY